MPILLRCDVVIAAAVQTQRSTFEHDSHGALTQLTARRGTDTLFATSYVRDSLSRITQLTERVNGTTQVVAFAYDSVGRLSSVTRNGTPTASYTYDLNGNRATKTTSGGTQTAVVDDQDRLTSYGGATYQYTAHGDLRRKIAGTDTTEYTYDALGNLTRVELPTGTVIGYLLDAMNRRIGKTVNDTLVKAWLYQGQLTPVAELDGSGSVVSRFVYATGVNVPDYLVRGDSTYRIIRDHLGSVRLVVNVASGTIAQRVSYDEFGIETENTNPGWQPFGYAGGLADSQTGLVRFGARDYDPVAGRWTAKDPIGFAGGTTSLYSYAANDAINAIDPIGTWYWLAIGAVAGASSAAFEAWGNGGSGWSILGSAAVGLIVGGATSVIPPLKMLGPGASAVIQGATGGALGNFSSQVIERIRSGREICALNVVTSGLYGAIGGRLFQPISKVFGNVSWLSPAERRFDDLSSELSAGLVGSLLELGERAFRDLVRPTRPEPGPVLPPNYPSNR
ncbi:MAG: hypothetical protein IT357_09160 [Gemmatimonadaceae bacterium]|nr:hypothetical protein [Gemmatimonadaceae bacterium]